MTHIVTADNEGSFYCRAVSGELNYKKGQYVCGRGCPCFVKCGGGEFICRYKEEEGEPLLFPRVEGLDQQLYKHMLLQRRHIEDKFERERMFHILRTLLQR